MSLFCAHICIHICRMCATAAANLGFVCVWLGVCVWLRVCWCQGVGKAVVEAVGEVVCVCASVRRKSSFLFAQHCAKNSQVKIRCYTWMRLFKIVCVCVCGRPSQQTAQA